MEKERVSIVTRGNYSIVVKDNRKEYRSKLAFRRQAESLAKAAKAISDFGRTLGNFKSIKI